MAGMVSGPGASCPRCPSDRPAGCVPAAYAAAVAFMPLLLAFAWTAAALVQTRPYDWTAQTISALTGRGAAHPWIMVTGLLLAGGTYLGLAMLLRVLTVRSRAVLAVGGIGVVVTALAPQPLQGDSPVHMGAAGCAWVALTLWPLTANLHAAARPLPRVGVAVTGVLLAELAWFLLELIHDGALLGAVERLLMLSLAGYPAYVARHLCLPGPARGRDRPRDHAGAHGREPDDSGGSRVRAGGAA
jgi:hypothetical membrane protein